jgi:ADP-dependent NAD(P)H-hydrate dehydratase / NAD(P)H-hydrate epimerase
MPWDDWRPVLTAAEMRSAEDRAISTGTSVETLMERAGRAAAEAIWRFAGPLPALVLCGPGNNGGDGYVVARELRARGLDVQVATLAEPQSDASRAARNSWEGEIASLEAVEPRPLLIDALFGTGLRRPLDDGLAQILCSFADQASATAAIDLPSGVATDDGCILSPVPDCDLTVTFQTLKPSHLLQPASRHMGRIVIADIGVEVQSSLKQIARPRLEAPGPEDHKYSRGYVAVMAGEMPGAGALTATGALRGGAGYVRLLGDKAGGVPQAVVQGGEASLHLEDSRIGAVAIGPGLGRGEEGKRRLALVLSANHPLVLDADALTLLAEGGLPHPMHIPILTPHAGEFARLVEDRSGSKVDQARRAAEQRHAVIVYKGPDTVVAAPDGRAAIASSAPTWLATAGTGDVLAGVVAAMRVSGLDPFEAACAGVWLHGRAAALAGPALIADDLLDHLPAAFAECL